MSSFKYAHLADLHLGSWRDDKMRHLSTTAFLKAIDNCQKQKVDFILFAGDLFNTALPSLDTLKIITKKLKEIKDLDIPIYVIPGSHDFSPSGKTMIDVLENAGLLKNVCKGKVDPQTKELSLSFTQDPKTRVKLTGMLGKRGLLEKMYYENLHRENLEQEPGYKIFLFHTTIAELLPKNFAMIESIPLSYLPKNFNYYAGGHIHHKNQLVLENNAQATYPGPLFPNNFQEIEQEGTGGYYLITVEDNNQTIEWQELPVIKITSLNLNCDHKSAEIVTFDIINYFENADLENTLITIKLHGSLSSGKVSDINFKLIFAELEKRGAYIVMKNTSKLQSSQFQEILISEPSSTEQLEEQLIKEHLGQSKLFKPEVESHLTTSLLASFNTTKRDGETITDFQKRLESDLNKLLVLNSP